MILCNILKIFARAYTQVTLWQQLLVLTWRNHLCRTRDRFSRNIYRSIWHRSLDTWDILHANTSPGLSERIYPK